MRTALLVLGRQVLGADFAQRMVAAEEKAMQELERRLAEYSTLILLDNMESIQPTPDGQTLPGVEDFGAFADFFSRLLKSSPATRLLFTTREALPAVLPWTRLDGYALKEYSDLLD